MVARRFSILLLSSVALISAGCASSSRATRGALPEPGPPIQRYLPLNDGFIYTYLSRGDSQLSPEMFMVRVRRMAPNTALLMTDAGTRTLNISPRGIERVAGGFILKAPLQQGASWRGEKGLIRILNMRARVSVPAGTFLDCIETVEEIPGVTRTTTYFCPDVGIARMVVEQWDGAIQVQQTSDLRSFGPPVDLGR